MALEPTTDRPWAMRGRNAWCRVRLCCDCGKEESVRKDNSSRRCKSCSARISGAAGMAAQARAKPPKPPSRARKRAVLEDRTCRHCCGQFYVRQSAVSAKTNASGNFCSRPCYNAWLAQTTIEGRRGRLWKRIARAAKETAPFCGWCGTVRGLQVHHIIPYRLAPNNETSNLIPLCPACHKRIETATKALEHGGGPLRTIPFIGAILRHRQRATAAVLRRLRADG